MKHKARIYSKAQAATEQWVIIRAPYAKTRPSCQTSESSGLLHYLYQTRTQSLVGGSSGVLALIVRPSSLH